MMENGVGGGLVKGLAKILGAGGKSASTALKNALEKLSPSLRARLANSGLLKGVDGAAETAKALPRFEPGRWLKHFDDHAAEFGYRTPVEYLRGARDFVARKDVETFTRVGGRTDGDRLFYDAGQQHVRRAEEGRRAQDLLPPAGRQGVLAEADRPRMSARLDLTPEEREQLGRVLAELATRTGREDSLGAMLGRWRDFVTTVERGYDDSIYEYTNDLSVRDHLEAVAAGAGPALRAKVAGRDRRGRPPVRGGDAGGRPPARRVHRGGPDVVAPRAATPRRRTGRGPRLARVDASVRCAMAGSSVMITSTPALHASRTAAGSLSV